MVIKWTNNWSGEVGYVKSINKDGKDFINTINRSEAESFTKATIKEKIALLETAQPQNTYVAIQSKSEEHAQLLKDIKSGKYTNDPKAAAYAKELKKVMAGNVEPATVKSVEKTPAKKSSAKKAASKKTTTKKTGKPASAKEAKKS